MSSAEAISDLLLHWEELREQGQAVSAEDLCRDRPELVEEVGRRVRALEAMYQVPNGVDPNRPTQTGAGPPALCQTDLPAIPGYELLGVLGSGGMGVVYKARQVGLKRLTALKMILSGAHAGALERARFRTEAEAIARLQHPNIVQIYEVGEYQGRPFLSLEFVDGGSLADRLDGKPWSAPQAAALVETVARAMHAAHQQGIVHRDLKPANILMPRDEGRGARNEENRSLAPRPSPLAPPKITDFGLAKRLDEETLRTQSGAILGTPGYMAPEQAEGRTRDIGPAADVYALGAILYELLTGRPPFQGATLLDTLEQVRSREPVPPSSLQPTVPRDLSTICLKCLEKEPRNRYASAQELAEDLARHLHGELIHARGFTLVDRVTRTLNRSTPEAAQFGALSNVLLVMTPIPALTHLAGWLVIRLGGFEPWTWLLVTFLTALVFLCILLWASWGRRIMPTGAALRVFWSIRIGYLTGLVLIPAICRLMATPERPWDPFSTYPLWAVLGGVTIFGMGGSLWGRFYLMGLSLFASAFVMTWRLEWAPLEFGLILSCWIGSVTLHLRRLRADRLRESSFS